MTHYAAAANAYKSVHVNTCSPAKLVQLLLEGALRFASEASDAIERGDRARTGERIGKCHAILVELESSLDAEKAPELCAQLSAVYQFCRGRLFDANVQRSTAALADVRKALLPLRDAWAELAQRPSP